MHISLISSGQAEGIRREYSEDGAQILISFLLIFFILILIKFRNTVGDTMHADVFLKLLRYFKI